MTRMHLYFWKYASSWGDITEKVRRKLIINTTTIPTDLKRNQNYFKSILSTEFIEILQPIAKNLLEKKKMKAGKKDYELLVYPYFAQMKLVIQELYRVLKIGSPLHFIIGDSALYGVHIETHNFLAQLMTESGFKIIKIDNLRKRGHRWLLKKRQGAENGLGEFEILAQKI